MVQVPEEERLEVLRKLQSGKKEVAAELSRFPLVVETLSRKKAKKALEAKMKEIEDAIKVGFFFFPHSRAPKKRKQPKKEPAATEKKDGTV
eukprot:jgi/Bigna1/137668/aug1.40_g12376